MPSCSSPMRMKDLTDRPEPPGCLSADEALEVCSTAEGPAAAAARAHIQACERCRVLVAEAARAIAEVASTRSGSLLTLSEGEQVAGRYRIVRFLARGGMGEVYQAFDQMLQEQVALKTLVATAVDDDRAMTRLMVEVRLARRVTHPNVCRILEFGFHAPATWKDGRLPFLTMELLEGESLSQRLARSGPLPPEQALPLVQQMVAGLAAIHGAGIVHRDWKSDNVFLARASGGLERVVVMDFGLALGAAAGRWSHGTGGGLAGTADYIAPEQLCGGPATPAADIYALGVVLHELVTGKRPFSGASTIETAMNRLRMRPPAPSALVPGLPPAWDRAVLGCLELQPERRFACAEDVLDVLQATGAANRLRARRPLGTVWTTRRLVALASGLAVAASLALWGVQSARRGGPTRIPPVAPARPLAPVAAVPVNAKPALLGRKWPVRQIPVCLQSVRVDRDPEAAVFEVMAMLDFTWNSVADFWFHDAGPCPADPRGMIALSLDEGSHHRADLGYRPDGPVRVHIGNEPLGRHDRVVHAFGRALGLGLRGDWVLSAEEIMLVRTVYGRKPPGSLAGAWGRCLSRTPGKPSATLSRCTGGADEIWRRDSGRRQLRGPANEPTCVGVQRSTSRRQAVLISDCQGGRRDVVSLRATSWRAVGDRCATAASARADAEIAVAGCDGRALQRWDFFEGDESIRLHGTDLCVTAPTNAIERGVGTGLTLQRCRRGAGQQFHFAPGGLIKLDPTVDLCLTMLMRAPDAGRLGLASRCHEVPAVAFNRVFSIVGPMRIGDGCVTVPGQPDHHAPVWVMPCVGGWNHQRWEYWW
jgi:tRNA A-37 threonylcarbamoyl transferase component Bud32